MDPIADDSFAEIFARRRLGIAIAAITRMIATTISNSISEKPCCRRIGSVPDLQHLWCSSAAITAYIAKL
jgi:hypothetical protein